MLGNMLSDGGVFWVFLAVVVGAAMWRKAAATREAHATIRLALEKGQPLDPAVVAKILETTQGGDPRRAGAILIAMGLGFPIMGYLLDRGGATSAFYPFTGIGVLLLLMGVAQVTLWALTRNSDGGKNRLES